jgi:hypothetical protein
VSDDGTRFAARDVIAGAVMSECGVSLDVALVVAEAALVRLTRTGFAVVRVDALH